MSLSQNHNSSKPLQKSMQEWKSNIMKHFAEKRKEKGLGDTIKSVTEAFHIPQCGGCKKRQAKLNKLFPYENKN